MINLENKTIILFDGVCNLCNNTIQFIIKRDSKQHFLFSSLQSDASKSILLQFQIKNLDLNSIILLENNKIYDKSTAALKIARKLPGIYKFMYVFIIVPKFIRDIFYTIIAKNRYKWFGKRTSCMVPTAAIKTRFLE